MKTLQQHSISVFWVFFVRNKDHGIICNYVIIIPPVCTNVITVFFLCAQSQPQTLTKGTGKGLTVAVLSERLFSLRQLA